ncbi:RES domain-containing protein, partial [Rhizobium sp. YIM 134829]
RFDTHHVARAEDPERGVWYGASSPDAAVAEAFRSIARSTANDTPLT